MASDNSSNFDQSLHTFQSSVFQKVITDAINFLISSPVEPLPPNHSFPGAGVYLLYYKGSFEPYSPIAEANTKKMNMPIYAGKAVPSGWRQSRSVTNTSPALYNRLKKHARSIQAVINASKVLLHQHANLILP
ncbi:MAG: Eco29kI family restriction endonuclease [Rhodospirillales bacterium]|nr:MAG: Eco29kI family restriction endonuclease [Rhodospirillales bacterium]